MLDLDGRKSFMKVELQAAGRKLPTHAMKSLKCH
jgi:hypothetical protein